MQYQIAIIGKKDIIGGFKALGAVPYPANNAEEAITQVRVLREKTLNPDSSERYAVIFLLEDLAEHIPEDEYTKISAGPLPALLIIPGVEGSRGTSISRLKQLAERAIGSDILK